MKLKLTAKIEKDASLKSMMEQYVSRGEGWSASQLFDFAEKILDKYEGNKNLAKLQHHSDNHAQWEKKEVTSLLNEIKIEMKL